MPRKLDPVIADVLKKYGEGPDACWDCHGVWVVYHKALERVAAKAGIVFDPPQVLEGDSVKKTVAICVNGRLGDRSEWSIGEAAPQNNKNNYPWAMGEKRAKDRVILKLIGLHGEVYSEEEADDFKYGDTSQTPADLTPAADQQMADNITAAMKKRKPVPDGLPRNEQEYKEAAKVLITAINGCMTASAVDRVMKQAVWLEYCPSALLLQKIEDVMEGRKLILETPDNTMLAGG